MIVYVAVNRVNQKAYVGMTQKSLSERFAVHADKVRNGYRSHFYSAVRKYGWESFDVAVLQSCEEITECAEAEKNWIALLGSQTPNGYNISDGGQGASIRGHLKSAKWRESVTSERIRKFQSQRVKALRASLSPEAREAWRNNAAASRRGLPNLKHRGDGNPAKLPENRRKITEGQARAWADPVKREKRLAAIRATLARKKESV